ncbi:MAG: HEAT repeat domain-containing protein [Planctomycetota bacterium]
MTSLPNVPRPRRLALSAALLALLVLPDRGVPAAEPSAAARQAADQVLDYLASENDDLAAVALDRVRHGLKGSWFTRAACDRLSGLEAGRQAALLRALADRGDAAAVSVAVKTLASSREPDLRAAAVQVVGRLGGAADVAILMTSLTADGPEREAARRGLVEIAGPDAAAAIRAAAGSGTPAARAIVIDVLAERRDRSALPVLTAAVTADDARLRGAALRALARFGGAAEIPAMVSGLLKSAAEERKEAELAIVSVCTVSPEATGATAALLERHRAADEAERRLLLPTLARVGGPRVMEIIDGMLGNPTTRPQAIDALAKWPDASVKDRLLDMVGQATDPQERGLLLGALIRIAPLPDNKLDDRGKLELVRQTMTLCQTTDDRARLLERANAIRTIEAFRFVAPYLDDRSLAEPACRSVVELAHHQKLRDAHKEEFLVALDKVLAPTADEELRERAIRYKAGRTWDRKQKN